MLSCPSFAPSAAYAVSLAPGCSISRRHLQLRPHGDNFSPPFSPPCCVVFPQCSPFPVESPQSCSNVLLLVLGLRLQMPAIFILVPNVPLCANRSFRPIKPYETRAVQWSVQYPRDAKHPAVCQMELSLLACYAKREATNRTGSPRSKCASLWQTTTESPPSRNSGS